MSSGNKKWEILFSFLRLFTLSTSNLSSFVHFRLGFNLKRGSADGKIDENLIFFYVNFSLLEYEQKLPMYFIEAHKNFDVCNLDAMERRRKYFLFPESPKLNKN